MQHVRSLKVRSRVLSLCWSPDGDFLTAGLELSSGPEAGAVQWDTATWRRARRWKDPASPLAAAAGRCPGGVVTAIGDIRGFLFVTPAAGKPFVPLHAGQHVTEIIGLENYLGRPVEAGDADAVDGLVNPGFGALRFSPDGRLLLNRTAD